MYDTKEEIALIIEKEKQFSLDFFIPRYHAQMEIWTPTVGGDSVHLKCDN